MHESSWLQGSWEGQGLSVGVLLGIALVCTVWQPVSGAGSKANSLN